jgi:hypothetical protein
LQREKLPLFFSGDLQNLSLHSFLNRVLMSIYSSGNSERFLTPVVSAAREGRFLQKKNTRAFPSKNARDLISYGNCMDWAPWKNKMV